MIALGFRVEGLEVSLFRALVGLAPPRSGGASAADAAVSTECSTVGSVFCCTIASNQITRHSMGLYNMPVLATYIYIPNAIQIFIFFQKNVVMAISNIH